MKKSITNQILTGERALFKSEGIEIRDSIFADGESPLKESNDIDITGSMFKWKYPLWYCNNINVNDTTWFEMARAGVWYTDHIIVTDCAIEAPKNFRRCRDLTLTNVSMPSAAETLWNCTDVRLSKVVAKGDYFAMGCKNLDVDRLTLYGNYSFDGVKNMVIRNSRLLSKDAFWNSENVTVENCFISGEYLGWNAKNLTLINCTIESLQGMCYIDNLVMKNCKLINTTSGTITADSIGELIMERDKINPTMTKIICREDEKKPICRAV